MSERETEGADDLREREEEMMLARLLYPWELECTCEICQKERDKAVSDEGAIRTDGG
jgi:hypothetical protein